MAQITDEQVDAGSPVNTNLMAQLQDTNNTFDDMGTYTGSTITDNETAKENIQELEVAHELLQTQILATTTNYSNATVHSDSSIGGWDVDPNGTFTVAATASAAPGVCNIVYDYEQDTATSTGAVRIMQNSSGTYEQVGLTVTRNNIPWQAEQIFGGFVPASVGSFTVRMETFCTAGQVSTRNRVVVAKRTG